MGGAGQGMAARGVAAFVGIWMIIAVAGAAQAAPGAFAGAGADPLFSVCVAVMADLDEPVNLTSQRCSPVEPPVDAFEHEGFVSEEIRQLLINPEISAGVMGPSGEDVVCVRIAGPNSISLDCRDICERLTIQTRMCQLVPWPNVEIITPS